jgi:hypothetical protein
MVTMRSFRSYVNDLCGECFPSETSTRYDELEAAWHKSDAKVSDDPVLEPQN